MKKVYKNIYKKIKKYDTIVIFGHKNTDLDCLGSQFGLKEWIKTNFANKKVYALGVENNIYQDSFFPNFNNEKNFKDFLAISVDVSPLDRIEKSEVFALAEEKICIDHHLTNDTEMYDISYIDPGVIANAQIISDFILSFKNKKITSDIAKYLYAGIVGDSNSFHYDRVNSETLRIASELLKKGNINPFNDVNKHVIDISYDEVKLSSHIASYIEYDNRGFAYYNIDINTIKSLNVKSAEVTNKINYFTNIKEFDIILAVAQDGKDSYRASIRSKNKSVVEIANKYGGGGHKKASGVKNITLENVLKMKEELKALLKDLKA